MKLCPECKTERKKATCWKCGSQLFEACEGWTEPKLPDVDIIRKLAKEVGYAIGEHGSKERDLDLIAVPWTEDAVGCLGLIIHLCTELKANWINEEEKPHGRIAVTIQLDGYYKSIDLSILPRQ